MVLQKLSISILLSCPSPRRDVTLSTEEFKASREKKRVLSEQIKYSLFRDHKARVFADNLSLFSSTSEDHQLALQEIDSKYISIDPEICPDKCFSLLLHNQICHSNSMECPPAGSNLNYLISSDKHCMGVCVESLKNY